MHATEYSKPLAAPRLVSDDRHAHLRKHPARLLVRGLGRLIKWPTNTYQGRISLLGRICICALFMRRHVRANALVFFSFVLTAYRGVV
jgi:hypothetical protein